MEPFVLHGTATDPEWDMFRSEVEKRAQAVQKLAQEFNLPFVPLQKLLDDVFPEAPAGYWLADGVHPTAAGHYLIAQEWLKAFNSVVK